MELICPSCEARYRVPDGAIGERGRQVSCTNCGHGWHAVPPLALGAAAGGGAHRLRHDDEAGQAGGQAGAQAGTAEIHRLRPSDPARKAQLAEIREMIAQVQADDGAPAATVRPAPEAGRYAPAGAEVRRGPDAHVAAPAVPAVAPAAAAASGTAPAAGRPRTEGRRADEVDESGEAPHQDPLRRRMAEHDARAAREREDRERLRRSMQEREDAPGPGSGAFLAGFLLVVLVAAAMLAAYLLHDEIVARVPESEPVLTEYVAVMDDLRVSIAEGYERARAWVMDLIADVA